jgi:heptosyltransferase-3
VLSALRGLVECLDAVDDRAGELSTGGACRTVREVTIIHQGALGDFVLSLPVYSGLHALYPSLSLHFITKPSYRELLVNLPYFGSSGSCDGPELGGLYLDQEWRNSPQIPAVLRSDAIFWLGQKSSRSVAARLQSRSGKPVHWIQSFPGADSNEPVSNFLIAQVRQLSYPIPYSLPALSLRPERRQRGLEPTGVAGTGSAEPVLIHPGSGGRTKIWPLVCWGALVHWLQEAGCTVRIVLGPADGALNGFAEAMEATGCTAFLNPSLSRLAALIGSSRITVGNDSGVSHLAAALGARIVAVFGPASPAFWHPRGRNVRVVTEYWDAETALAWPASTSAAQIDGVTRAIRDLLGRPIRYPLML